MRVLVQNCATGLYLAENCNWMSSYRDALNFMGTVQALDYCVEKKMENVRIVLKFSDSVEDVLLPVTSTGCQS